MPRPPLPYRCPRAIPAVEERHLAAPPRAISSCPRATPLLRQAHAEASHRDARRGAALGWTAVALGATAAWSYWQGRRAERRFPPAGRFIDVAGVRLHYLDTGRGSPVVLLHGNGAMASDFAGCGLIRALSERHRVIAFDRPGFGYSTRPRHGGIWSAARQADLLRQAWQRLGVDRPVVAAHSWGTHVALALALDHPAALRGLVLVAGYYYPSLRLDVLLGGPRLPLIGDVLRYTLSPVSARLMLPGLLRRMFSPHPVAPAFLSAVPMPLALRPWQIRASAEEAGIMPASAAQLAPRYGTLDLPVHIFAGSEDKLVTQPDQATRLHQELPRSILHLLPGEGHMLHYRASAAIAEAITSLAHPAPADTASPPSPEAA